MTDRGLAAVTSAEEAAFGGTSLDLPRARPVVEALVARVVGGSWWRACGRPDVVVIGRRRSTRSSSARRRDGLIELRLADEQLTAATAGHELGHALAGPEHGHDAVFRAAYIDVVALLGGVAAATMLTEAYHAFGLDVAARRWPPPVRAIGDSFLLTVASAPAEGSPAPPIC